MSAVTFNIGVDFIPLEFLSVCYFIININNPLKVRLKKLQFFLKAIIFVGLLYMLVQLFTDSYLGIPFFETFKSLAQIFTLLSLIYTGINLLASHTERLFSFLVGYAISSLITILFFRNTYIDSDPWKFLFANASSILIFLLLGKLIQNRGLQLLIILTLTAIHLIFGSRSSALLTLLTVIAIIIPRRLIASRKSFVIIALSVFLISAGTEQVYQQLALNGTLGLKQQLKATQQYESGPLIFFARSETLYEYGSIKESFIFGKGSNPDLSQTLLFSISAMQEQLELQTKKTAAYKYYLETGKIPQHSMLFSSWVENGLIGLIFWLILMLFFIKNFRLVVSSDNQFTFLTTYLLVSALWSLFFSPLGAGSRLFIAITVTCIARILLAEHRMEEKHD